MKSRRTIRIFVFACLMILVVSSLASCGTSAAYLSTGTELILKKTASPSTVTQAGEVITYNYVVTYNPSYARIVKLTSMEFSISDSPLDGPISCPKTLEIGKSVTCTATYTVTEADIAAGGVTNHASATGTFYSHDTKTNSCGFFTQEFFTKHTVTDTASVTVTVGIPPQSDVTPPATETPVAKVPTPILTGAVTYCDASAHVMNLRLVEGFAPTDFNHQVTIGQTPMDCKVNTSNTTLLSCLYPPSVIFPAIIQVTLDGNILDEFEFNGEGCVLPEKPKDPGDGPVAPNCIEDPFNPGC